MKSKFSTCFTEQMIFPPIELFVLAFSMQHVYIEVNENYQKGSYRNKTKILTANGVKILSIPLQKGKHNQMAIKDVAISYEEDWVQNWKKTIRSSYGSSPYFGYYFDRVARLLSEPKSTLFSLSNHALIGVCNWIEVPFTLMYTTDYRAKIMEPDSIDIRGLLKPKGSSPAYFNQIPYSQVFEDKFGFVEGLGILDLLFNVGPYSAQYLHENAINIDFDVLRSLQSA